MAPSRRPRGERLAEAGRAQIRELCVGDAIPARSRRDRVADTPPPTAPVIPAASALPPTLAPWKGRPCPEKVGSQAHRPTSAILPAAVKRPSDLVPAALQSMSPNRTDAPLCLQLSDGRFRRAGQLLAVSAGRGPAPPSWPPPPAASAGSRSGRSIWSLSPTASPPSGSAAAARGGSNPTVVPCQPCWPRFQGTDPASACQ